MKTLFWIMGGMVCVALVIWAMYAALTIGLSMYIAHTNMLRGEEVAKQQQEAEAQQIRKSIAATGENMNPSVAGKHDADELSGKLPSLSRTRKVTRPRTTGSRRRSAGRSRRWLLWRRIPMRHYPS